MLFKVSGYRQDSCGITWQGPACSLCCLVHTIGVVTQHAAHWVPGELFPGLKWPDDEVGHSPPVADEVTITGNFTALSYLSHGIMINHKENFVA